MNQEEIWKPVVRNSNYEVSNLGQVRRVTAARGAKVGRILKLLSNGRYYQVGLFVGNKSKKELVHILVMEAFKGPCPAGQEVNHEDTIRSNNRLSNLEYCTPTANMQHASVNRLLRFGKENHMTKLTEDQVVWIRQEVSGGKTCHAVARELGISFQHVSKIARGEKRSSVKLTKQRVLEEEDDGMPPF